MDEERNCDPPFTKIDAQLRAMAEVAATPPPWQPGFLKLTPDSALEQRLAVFQAIRQAGSVPDDASFFLVSYVIDEIATRDADGALRDYEDRLHAIEREFRLNGGGVWASGAAPSGYEQLRKAYYRAWDAAFACKLAEFGEVEMADLFREDRATFDAKTEAGRQFFHGPQTTKEIELFVWVRALVESIADCLTADSPMGPLGFRYRDEDGCGLIDVYPTPVELIGGATDGQLVAPGFSLDLEQLRQVFDRVDGLAWQSLGFPEAEGPHVAVEGIYRGHEAFVQVLAYAPEDEGPGMKIDTARKER